MDTASRKRIEQTNWLAHRWSPEVRKRDWGGYRLHELIVEGQVVATTVNGQQVSRMLTEMRPVCLARWIADAPELHPAVVLIIAGNVRLGRVPPDKWCGYDVTPITSTGVMRRALSARARAMFPDHPDVFIIAVLKGEVRKLGLRPLAIEIAIKAESLG